MSPPGNSAPFSEMPHGQFGLPKRDVPSTNHMRCHQSRACTCPESVCPEMCPELCPEMCGVRARKHAGLTWPLARLVNVHPTSKELFPCWFKAERANPSHPQRDIASPHQVAVCRSRILERGAAYSGGLCPICTHRLHHLHPPRAAINCPAFPRLIFFPLQPVCKARVP